MSMSMANTRGRLKKVHAFNCVSSPFRKLGFGMGVKMKKDWVEEVFRLSSSEAVFKTNLKTHLFRRAFDL